MAGKGYVPSDEAKFLKEPDPRMFNVRFGGYENPSDVWEPSRIRGTVQVGPAVPANKYVPTAEESALAVAWFQCRRDTHLTETLVRLAEQVQAEIVSRHEVQFAELNPRLATLARDAARIAGS